MVVHRRGDIIARLRQRIATAFHLGLISAGDRLPSSRRLAREFRANERVILAAYRVLEGEGLVEFRPRSGIYLAKQKPAARQLLPNFADWVLDVLADGLARGIPAVEVPGWLRQTLRTVRLRAACLECNHDHIDALCGELHRDYGLATTPIDLDRLGRPAVVKALRAADVLVTTTTHADVVSRVSEELEKPCIAVSWRPDIMDEIATLLRAGPVYFIGSDPRFVAKLRRVFDSSGERGNLRAMVADSADLASIPDAAPVYITSRARDRLGSAGDRLRAVPLDRLLVASSAREVLSFVIGANLSALQTLAQSEPRTK